MEWTLDVFLSDEFPLLWHNYGLWEWSLSTNILPAPDDVLVVEFRLHVPSHVLDNIHAFIVLNEVIYNHASVKLVIRLDVQLLLRHNVYLVIRLKADLLINHYLMCADLVLFIILFLILFFWIFIFRFWPMDFPDFWLDYVIILNYFPRNNLLTLKFFWLVVDVGYVLFLLIWLAFHDQIPWLQLILNSSSRRLRWSRFVLFIHEEGFQCSLLLSFVRSCVLSGFFIWLHFCLVDFWTDCVRLFVIWGKWSFFLLSVRLAICGGLFLTVFLLLGWSASTSFGFLILYIILFHFLNKF